MKRFHVHVCVADLEKSVRFYSTVFGTAPAVRKNDYAKWMLDDPCLNFAISKRGRAVGVNHLGIQVDSDEELGALRQAVASADVQVMDQKNATCCYAKSDKYWVLDPQGVAWETFHTLGEAPVYGADSASSAKERACCAPE